MKLTYLGTAAAEGWPAVFCNCEYCLKAKKLGGRNIRTRSQAMINDNLLIDFPSDSYMHILQNGIDCSAVEYIFFTHTHIDHCMPTDLFFRSEGVYSHLLTKPTVSLYGNKSVKERIGSIANVYNDERFDSSFNIIEAYKPVEVGDYRVTALRANHSYGEDAFVYLIEQGEKTLLYLHDTGLPYDDVYKYLADNHIKADLVSYDCTYVALPSAGGHMGLDTNETLKEKLTEMGIIDSNTINVINHFSHNGKLVYDELKVEADKLGFITSYDGLAIEF